MTQSPRDGTAPQAFPAFCQVGAESCPTRRRSLKRSHARTTSFLSSTPTSPQKSHFTAPSDMDITHHLYRLLDQVDAPGVDLVDVYQQASMLPPVTHDSLSELDIIRIINNPKLRHDVNFDKELHFRPNLDGSRGKHKINAAEDYWKSLVAELELYRLVGVHLMACNTRADAEYWTRMMTRSQKRLPGMFETIRDVLKTLVPEHDQSAVAERLDIAMIMQQVSKGVFDLMSLANWLATLLKAHCAPMRDDWIDQMVEQTQRGVDEGSQERVVVGLRQLLGILEAMKLDVANHQIRHLRSLLIEDTVPFQQRYHIHRLTTGRIDMARAKRWLAKEHTRLQVDHQTTADKLQTFTSAILRAVLSPLSMTNLPDTFQLDLDRLRAVRHDLHHLMTLEICCDMFEEAALNVSGPEAMQHARKSLKESLADILADRRRPAEHAGNIAAEMIRLMQSGSMMPAIDSADLIDQIEARLKIDLPLSSAAIAFRGKIIHEQETAALHDSIKSSLKLTTTALHETMMPSSSTAQPFGINSGKVKDATEPIAKRQTLADVLRRVTHVAVLHWQVWFAIVYDVTDDLACRARSQTERRLRPEAALRESKSTSTTSSGSDFENQSADAEMYKLPPATLPRSEDVDADNVPQTPTGPAMTEPKA